MGQPSKKRLPTLKIVRSPGARIRGHQAGWIAAVDGDQILIDHPGNAHGPLPARATIELARLKAGYAAAADSRCAVLLVFEQERSDQPIIVGLLNPTAQPTEATVDGKRVVLDGQDEVVLRCGEASITLRRNGRVVIRGTYVETRARGVNRIRGGSVQIN